MSRNRRGNADRGRSLKAVLVGGPSGGLLPLVWLGLAGGRVCYTDRSPSGDEVASAINAKHGEGRAIAVPANIHFLTTYLFNLVTGNPPAYEKAASVSVLLPLAKAA